MASAPHKAPPSERGLHSQRERVLVVGPAWIGDMVIAQSLYKSLKNENPAVEIDVLAPAWSLPLLKRMPEVSDGIVLNAAHGELKLGLRRELGHRLRQNAYTRAIVLPRSFKSALVPWFAGIPQRTGYRGEMRYGVINDMRVLNKNAMPRLVERFIKLGLPPSDGGRRQSDKPLDIPEPSLLIDEDNRRRVLQRLKLNPRRQILMLAPGAAYGKAKQWPAERFAEVADHHLARDWDVWVLGSSQEFGIAREIVTRSGGKAVNLCGETTLEEAIDLLSMAQRVVSNDSGLMHIAAAVGVSLVAVYGSSSPLYTPPLSAKARVVYHDIVCSPCWARQCRYGHYRCLTDIKAEEVIHHHSIRQQ